MRVAAAVLTGVLALVGCSDAGDSSPAEASGPSPRPSSSSPTAAAPARSAARVSRPHTAAEAAAALAAAEPAVRSSATSEKDLVRAARAQQLAYRELGAHPRWDAAVLRGVPAELRDDVRANVASRREFRAMHTTLSDTLPAWRIVAPSPAEDLQRFYRQGERTFGVEWEYLAAINLVETAMGRIRGTSVAGAQGPMQFLPSTWDRWGRGDIDDPHDAILAAARYLAHNGGGRGQIAQALYRYNNSEHYVRGVTRLAEVMQRDPRAYLGYYHWDVYYLTTRGDVRLPVGYDQRRPVPVADWLTDHPQQG
ncbi:transglycosylase SLT domain-containing protein [Nocardioides anomalus]|uniref:Transglycosylase SLT domain-containing protein n=1 Tax=Nocardioides anomalus TaxID=2712223 RepID=A0A6G6WC16_9ACTN|nr:transglycosylase SLT domain-containing protein [Nocardioides anomalus]QIG42693.1 transglycosylase SLT domain-containing protein [Nocardioides anomalus]